MAFDSEFLDELRARTGLAEVIGRRVALRRQGQEWAGLCPFHKEKTPSFTVNESKGFYHCFGCGAHGSAIDFVMNTEGLSFPEAVEKLAREAGMELPAPDPNARQRAEARKGLIELMAAVAQWFQAQLAATPGAEARDYLARRGLSPEVVGHFRLGYAPEARDGMLSAMRARGFALEQLLEAGLVRRPEAGGEAYDFFRHRVIFPIAGGDGRIVAFGGRALGEARAKYLNSPETALFHKGGTLYNLDHARKAAHEAGSVIVAEGYMDVIALHRAGLAQAVAPLGTALTEDQLRALWRLAPEPVLCFDGDAAGQRAAYRAAERALALLQPGRSLGFVELPPGQDPDDVLNRRGAARLQGMFAKPLTLADVLWRQALEGRELDTPERRAGLRRDLGQLVNQIGNETVRVYYRQHFSVALDGLFASARPNRRPGRGLARVRTVDGRVSRFLGPHLELQERHAMEALKSPVGRERALMALVLSHPALLDEVFEDFAGLHFASPELDRLHRQLLEHVALRQALDVAQLTHDLTDKALSQVVGGLTGSAAAKLTPSAAAEASLDEAQDDWNEIYRIHRLSSLEAEYRAAETSLAEAPTDEDLTRLIALKAELDRARREADMVGLV